jgi:hypothetical protein
MPTEDQIDAVASMLRNVKEVESLRALAVLVLAAAEDARPPATRRNFEGPAAARKHQEACDGVDRTLPPGLVVGSGSREVA